MRTIVVATRLVNQILADKRAIALMFVAPVFLLFLMYVVITSMTSTPAIDLVAAPESVVEALQERAEVTVLESEDEALARLKDGSADAFLVFAGDGHRVVLEGTNPTISRLALTVLREALIEALEPLPGSAAPPLSSTPIDYLYGSQDYSSFDFFAPVAMGFIIFFFVFVIAGIAFLRERISGTLERALASPLRRWEMVLGYFLGFGIFVAFQTVIIQLFMVYGLKAPTEGSPWLVLLLNLLMAMVALSLSTFLSAYARSEFQMFQFIPIVITPQVLFSGLIELREAPDWVNHLSQLFPLTYGGKALRDVMLRGLGFGEVWRDAAILLAFAVAFLLLNAVALKKYRRV